MSLTVTIFLSSLVLGLILLYISTKDRWDWRKIIGRMVGWPLIGMFVLGVGWVIYQFHSEWSKEPQVQTEYWGLSLGSSKSDVKFLKGEPKKINQVENGESWEFADGVGRSIFRVDFVENSIARVMRIGQDGGFYRSIQGISPGYSNLETILEKLGDPSNISISEDKNNRIYNFDGYNLFFGLTKNKVNILGIYDPRTGPIRLALEKE